MAGQRIFSTAIAAWCAIGAGTAAGDFIDFETTWNGGAIDAPSLFADTASLTTLYAPVGVTFSGGGAILDTTSNFGIDARSGNNFLAFNARTYANGPAEIAFSTNIDSFSIFGGGADARTFLLQVFDDDQLIGTVTADSSAGAYAQIAYSGDRGFNNVVISETSAAGTFVLDDLSFEIQTLPAPGTLAAIALLGGLTARHRVQ